MVSVKMPSHLVSNRLIQEGNEDRHYNSHRKRLNEIRCTKSLLSHEPSFRFPSIHKRNDIDFLKQMHQDSNRSIKYNRYNSRTKLENWSHEQQKARFRNIRAAKQRDIDLENIRLLKKLDAVKPTLNKKEWEKDFTLHQNIVHTSSKKHYTPRGFGQRSDASSDSLTPKEIQKKDDRKTPEKPKKNAIKMLNAAVNKTDAADTVLIKTMASLNYYERIETKKKYEETYGTDLKKGLLKVMDKSYEPLIHAFLTDKNVHDAERIYESLYEPQEAGVVISEALLSRYLSERDALREQFKLTIDSDIETEIDEKIEGDFKTFLLNFLQNRALDNELLQKSMEETIKNSVNEFKKMHVIPTNSDIVLTLIKRDSKKQMKLLFDTYYKETKYDIITKFDADKAITKAIKMIQSYLNNPYLYNAERLNRSLKTNKSEFLRLLAVSSKDDLVKISKEYKQKYKLTLADDLKANYPEDLTRIAIKMIE